MGIGYAILVLDREGLLPNRLYNLLTLQALPISLRVLLPLTVGGLLVMTAVLRLTLNVIAPFRPTEGMIVDSLYEYSRTGRGPNIVAIGGGTGMPSLLRGLKNHTRTITAIVTVADDGGSSGRLRQSLGLLPPGDFRNNLAALAKDELLMTQVLQYRFGRQVTENGQENGRSELQGHAFGNLLLAALTGITGSFDEALLAAERVLALRGTVLPSTLQNVTLTANVRVGDTVQRVVGESIIPKAAGDIEHVQLEPGNVRAYPPAIKAILQADLILMGPGSLYTSILPNLLVPDIAEALARSRAPKVYICNLATQPGETYNYTVADHTNTVLRHIPTNFLTHVLANAKLSIPPETGGGQTGYVTPEPPDAVKMITADFVDTVQPWRHDSAKLAQAVMKLLSKN